MLVDRKKIDQVFSVGDRFLSGGGKVQLEIREILDDRVRIFSVESKNADRIWYKKLSLALEHIDSIDSRSVGSSLAKLFRENNLKMSISDPFLYGFAKEFLFRSGITSAQEFRRTEDERLRQALSLPDKTIERLASAGTTNPPKQVQVLSREFQRNQYVAAATLLRAGGKCEMCGSVAPFFRRSDGTPYLEVHHKIQLSNGGLDNLSNTIALCPNCHRRAHYA